MAYVGLIDPQANRVARQSDGFLGLGDLKDADHLVDQQGQKLGAQAGEFGLELLFGHPGLERVFLVVAL